MKVTLLFVLFAVVLAFDFTEKSEKVGIVFTKVSEARVSYDTYTLLYHFNIEHYLEMTEKVNDCMNGIANLCRWIKPSNCELVVQNLKHHFDYMKSDVEDIYSYKINQRVKRGLINLGGSIMHWLFGLIDEDTAKEYDKKIADLSNITEREHKLQAEQLLIIKETIQLNNDSFNALNDKLNQYMKNLADIQGYNLNKIKNLQLDERFLELTNVAQLIVMEHSRLSTQILNSLENTIKGKITQLVPMQTLTKDIEKLAEILGEDQTMPIDMQQEDVLHIFKFAITKAALIGRRLLIELTVPVIERTKYALHRSIPIPTKIDKQTIIISSQPLYFLISHDLREYILINNEEFFDSKANRKGELIISPSQNAHFTHDKSCEMSIFMSPLHNSIGNVCTTSLIPPAVYFVAIEKNALYYIHTEQTLHVLERCNGKAATMHAIQTSGYLKLNKKCRINTDKISIRPHLNTRFDSTKIIELPEATINLTIEALSPIIDDMPNSIDFEKRDNILVQNHNEDYRKLIAKTNKLIRENAYNVKFNEIYSDNFKTGIFSTCFAISFSIIVVVIILLILYKKFFHFSTWMKLATKLEQQSENIPKLFVREINHICEETRC